MGDLNIQSNALRGDYMHSIIDRTITEIHNDIVSVFGPGAADAYITKDGQPYYTRDGLEVLESLTFDNKLSEYVRKMLFQAAYDQGRKVGDGTTTMTVFYTNLYRMIREYGFNYPMAEFRKLWREVIEEINENIKKESVPMNDERLLSMLYTCTQDAEFTAKVYDKLKDAMLEGAYIIPQKSNIESDLEVTSYMHPLIKATKQFSIRPINKKEPHTVILHCNGMLDIAHFETIYGLMTQPLRAAVGMDENGQYIYDDLPIVVVLLCNGLTEATRRSTKEFVKYINEHKAEMGDLGKLNNVAIYTIDRYREMDNDMIEDLSTIITDEYGMGGLVNSMTFESMLYQAFNIQQAAGREIEELATFDSDPHCLAKMQDLFMKPYEVIFDDAEGIMINKELGPVAQKRYDDLRAEIKAEKSEARKFKLQKRLKAVYGQFIEVEVGSKLLKDSQRKFELFLDMIISAAEGVKYGVMPSNSILVAIKVTNKLHKMCRDLIIPSKFITSFNCKIRILALINRALIATLDDLIGNMYEVGELTDTRVDKYNELIKESDLKKFYMTMDGPSKFNDLFKPMFMDEFMGNDFYDHPTVRVEMGEEKKPLIIDAQITEPVTVMTNILENSVLVMELARAETFHVDGFMMNYI